MTRHRGSFLQMLGRWLLYDPIFGAYTELFSGLSPEVTSARNGAYSKFGIFLSLLSTDLTKLLPPLCCKISDLSRGLSEPRDPSTATFEASISGCNPSMQHD